MVDVLGIQPVKPVEKVFKVESRAQNMAALPELEFKYEVSYGDEILNITVDSNYKLLTISNEDYLAKEEIETVIGKRKVSEYIKSASVEGDVTTLEIYTNGLQVELLLHTQLKEVVSLLLQLMIVVNHMIKLVYQLI